MASDLPNAKMMLCCACCLSLLWHWQQAQACDASGHAELEPLPLHVILDPGSPIFMHVHCLKGMKACAQMLCVLSLCPSSAAEMVVSVDGKEILSETAMRSLLKRVDLQHLEDRAGGFFQVLPRCY